MPSSPFCEISKRFLHSKSGGGLAAPGILHAFPRFHLGIGRRPRSMSHILSDEHAEISFQANWIILAQEKIAIDGVGSDFLVAADDFFEASQVRGTAGIAPEGGIEARV